MSKKTSTTEQFFDVQKEKSKVKTLIVTEFFKAYFPIIYTSFNKDIWYLDLFAGPGLYKDGSKSTPIVLLDIINNWGNDTVRNHLKIVFNDHDPAFVSSLSNAVANHPVYSKMRYKPQVLCKAASDIDLSVYTNNNCPIFSFVDPWGYKDVTAAQVWKLVKNLGSDCVMFFNANRVLQDIGKEATAGDFAELFGDCYEEAKELQTKDGLSQKQKADGFLELFSKNLYMTSKKEAGKNFSTFILPFYMEADDTDKISHYIVFISKAHKAIQEMRKVMIKQGNSTSLMLGYNDKTAMQIAMISRIDNIFYAIVPVIKRLFAKYPAYYSKTYKVATLSKVLDGYAMSTGYRVLPYSESELKSVIEDLDKLGHIRVIFPEGKKSKKRITADREFQILNSIESV